METSFSMKVAGLHLGTWVSTWSKGCLLRGGWYLKAHTFTSPCPWCPSSFSRDKGRLQLSLQVGMLRVSNLPGAPHGAIPPAFLGRVSASPIPRCCWSFPGLGTCCVVVSGGASDILQGQL